MEFGKLVKHQNIIKIAITLESLIVETSGENI